MLAFYRLFSYSHCKLSPGCDNRKIWFHHERHYFFFAFFTGSISTMNWWSFLGRRFL